MRQLALLVFAAAMMLLPPAPARGECSSDPLCGMGPRDWCCPPSGDPCGKHPDTNSCRQDSKCVGIRYRGESVEGCIYDPTGFAVNCPTVGCIGRPTDAGPDVPNFDPDATPSPGASPGKR